MRTVVVATTLDFAGSPRRKEIADPNWVRHSARRRKVAHMLAFVRRYRACCAELVPGEWQAFHETGRFGGGAPADDHFCGAAAAAVARGQVVAVLDRFIGHRQSEFRRAVCRSALDPAVKRLLLFVNARRAWHVREEVTCPCPGRPGTREVITADVRRLALSIWRHIRKRHTRPDVRGIDPLLDASVAALVASTSSHCDVWASFATGGREPLSIPLHLPPCRGSQDKRGDKRRDRRGGQRGDKRALVGRRNTRIEIMPQGRSFTLRMIA